MNQAKNQIKDGQVFKGIYKARYEKKVNNYFKVIKTDGKTWYLPCQDVEMLFEKMHPAITPESISFFEKVKTIIGWSKK